MFPFLPLSGAIHHDLHHQWPRTNFQPFFTWADRLFQTDYKFSPEGLRAKLKAEKAAEVESTATTSTTATATARASASEATAGKTAKAD